MNIVSFDVGIYNLAWCFIEFKSSVNHAFMEREKEIMIRSCMELKYMDLWDNELSVDHYMDHYRRLYHYLSQYDRIWRKMDVLLIEKQLITKQCLNVQAFKMSQHLLCYFLIHYPSTSVILEYPAAFKSKLLFQETFSSKYARKQWAIEKTKWFLETDPIALGWFETYRKLDDVSDAILMSIVYFYTHKIKNVQEDS